MDEDRWLAQLEADKTAVRRDLPDLTRWFLATGVRIGEAIAVGWDTIDVDRAIVEIDYKILRVKGQGLIRVRRTKSDAGPLDDPLMREFVAALDRANRLAETSRGFVWRLATEHGHGLCVITEDSALAFLDLSVWENDESLHAFVYRSEHGRYVRDRARWFETTRQPSTVLWWVPTGTRPAVVDATRRLWHLRTHGPSERAFSLRRRFTPAGALILRPGQRRPRTMHGRHPDDRCSGAGQRRFDSPL